MKFIISADNFLKDLQVTFTGGFAIVAVLSVTVQIIKGFGIIILFLINFYKP